MQPGDLIWVRVDKADGRPHRWWQATVESFADGCLVAYTAVGNPVYHNPTRFPQSIYHQRHAIRSYYWPGRRHNLLELYGPDGDLRELYADIISPIEIGADGIRFIDHELDVSQLTGQVPEIVDQDEFAEAAALYGYADEFVRESYALAEQLRDVLANWRPLGVRSPASAGNPGD